MGRAVTRRSGMLLLQLNKQTDQKKRGGSMGTKWIKIASKENKNCNAKVSSPNLLPVTVGSFYLPRKKNILLRGCNLPGLVVAALLACLYRKRAQIPWQCQILHGGWHRSLFNAHEYILAVLYHKLNRLILLLDIRHFAAQTLWS